MSKSEKRKIIFVTFNQLGYSCLEKILQLDLVEVVHVFTLKPELTASISDYKDIVPLCEKFGVPFKKIKNINAEVDEISAIKPDFIFIIGWSQIVKAELLAIPRFGCVGFHPALLPKNRGRAAIPWHFINDEKFGGASLFFLDEGCDTGDIIGQVKFSLTDHDNAKTYYEKAEAGVLKIIERTLPQLIKNSFKAKKQNHALANYLLIRTPEDSYLDFKTAHTRQLFNQVRAVAYVYPTAYALYEKNKIEFLTATIVSKKEYIYSATPGQIITVQTNSLWVKTLDGIIEFKNLLVRGQKLPDCTTVFKVGHYFNR